MLDTILVGALLLAISFFVSLRRPFLVLGVYIFLLYFYDFFRRIMGTVGMDPAVFSPFSLWEEAVLGGIALAILIRWLTGKMGLPRAIRLSLFDLAFVAVAAWGLYKALSSPLPSAGIAAFRSYFQPMIALYLIRWIAPGEKELRKFLNAWLAVGFIVAVFGLWQFAGWSEQDYRNLGYFFENSWGEEIFVPTVGFGGALVLRPLSTLTGPNELGTHMLIFTFLAAYQFLFRKTASRWLYLFLAAVYAACLVVTYARTALLGAFLALGILFIAFLIDQGAKDWLARFFKRPRNLAVTAAVVVIILAGMSFSGIFRLFSETIQTLPQQYHVIDTLEGIDYVTASPGGIGMGLVGPRQGIYYPQEKAAHVEGSVFQIALDMGIVGLVGWLLLVFLGMYYGWLGFRQSTDLTRKALSLAALGSWAGSLLVFIFLPLVQAPALMNCLWLLAGAAITAANPRPVFSWQMAATRAVLQPQESRQG